jgi:hypothetical protein
MSTVTEKQPERILPPGGRSRWIRDLLLWLPGSLMLGALTAWVAVDAQLYFAPLLLFPLLMGVLLGVLLVLLMRMAQIGHRPTIVVGTLLAAALAAGGMHYLTYLSHCREIAAESANIDKARLFLPKDAARRIPSPPSNFFEYMQLQAAQERPIFPAYSVHGGFAWLLWGVEALALTAATFVVMVPALFLPFCRRCHSWYRTYRSARFPPPLLGRLAVELKLEIPPRLRSGRCRLQACLGGCGPTRCELAWEGFEGQTSFPRLWLHHEQRNRVMFIFDQYAEETGKDDHASCPRS